MSTILSKNASLVKLEKRISLLEKAVNLLLFGEYVEIPEDEKQETLSRLMNYIEGREEEFIDFEKFEAIVRDEKFIRERLREFWSSPKNTRNRLKNLRSKLNRVATT